MKLLKKYQEKKELAEERMRNAGREIDRLRSKHEYFLLRDVCRDLKEYQSNILNNLIQSLGEPSPDHGYIIKELDGDWWIEHNQVHSAEPLKQWIKRELNNETKQSKNM